MFFRIMCLRRITLMARTRSYRISLSKKERKIIRHLQRKTTSSDARTRYAVLLAADESIHGARLTNSDIANASGASVPTVIDVLKKYYGHGLRAGGNCTRKEPEFRYGTPESHRRGGGENHSNGMHRATGGVCALDVYASDTGKRSHP